MYGGKHIARGDTVFVFASANEGGQGLVARGVVDAAEAMARKRGIAGLVEAFLRDDRFLLASPNAYNRLGVGTTQLYDKTVVYNHKRHGDFRLGGRTFAFRVKPSFPRSLTKEFMLVDLVNNVDQLAESKQEVLARVIEKAASCDFRRLERATRNYGNVQTKKFFANALKPAAALHAN
jgi:hypothetical protein